MPSDGEYAEFHAAFESVSGDVLNVPPARDMFRHGWKAGRAFESHRLADSLAREARLRGLLAEIEWSGTAHTISGDGEPNWPACLFCLAFARDGHTFNCPLAALAAATSRGAEVAELREEIGRLTEALEDIVQAVEGSSIQVHGMRFIREIAQAALAAAAAAPAAGGQPRDGEEDDR